MRSSAAFPGINKSLYGDEVPEARERRHTEENDSRSGASLVNRRVGVLSRFGLTKFADVMMQASLD